jgi:glutathione S-transferase
MKLLEFPHSHFCEKARWALDYKGVPFQPVTIMPGVHVITVRRIAPGTSVPVLLDNSDVVQGSGAIMDYLDRKFPARPLTPVDAEERRICLDIERSVDKGFGRNIRQILYHGLLAHPDFIRYCFTQRMSGMKKLVFRMIYPLLRRRIYQTYVISDAKVEQAKHEFSVAMDELAERLKQGPYLVGGRFTRADLSVAALLSFLVMPEEHPFPWIAIPDAGSRAFIDGYRDHPVSAWVRRMYRDHRAVSG